MSMCNQNRLRCSSSPKGCLTLRFMGFVINKQPRIPVLVEIIAHHRSRVVSFLVDSGATYSAISEKELELMGLGSSIFPEEKKTSIGFGGTFRNRVVNCPVHLTFGSDKQRHRIVVDGGLKIICIPPDKKPEERERMLQLTPSILGMDVLCKFNVHIYKRTIELELPE